MNDANLAPSLSLSTANAPAVMETTAIANVSRAERLVYLRQQEQRSTLSPDEHAELLRYYQEIEDEEVVRLRPASQALRQEATQIEAENAVLRNLIARREALMARLQHTLQETRIEQAAINAELARLIGTGRDADVIAR